MNKEEIIKSFTKSQLKNFNEENEEMQEGILIALSQKPVSKILKCGYTILVQYIYNNDGELGYHYELNDQEGNIMFKQDFYCDDIQGDERKSVRISECIDALIGSLLENEKLMKKIFI